MGEIVDYVNLESRDSGAINMNSVTSPTTRIYLVGPNQAITGMVSEYLRMTLSSLLTLPFGQIDTTVTRQLCAECLGPSGKDAWDETAITLLGDFVRSGSCFNESEAEFCPNNISAQSL